MKPAALVVDDSLTVRMDLAEALEDAGFEVHPCPDLATAGEYLDRPRLALVVLDLLLPDGSGLDFLRRLRAHAAAADVPVMLLSSEADVRSRVEGMRAGADEYVGKPYDLGQLVARARSLVQRAPDKDAAPAILIIDDSATFREELAAHLSGAGYRVTQAGSGEEGLTMAATLRPHAVVVDGLLPGIDGATVIRRLTSDAVLRGTPCVLMTASEGAADELRALEAGADAFFPKGAPFDVVLLRLGALLRRAHQTTTGEASLLAPKRVLAIDDSATYLDVLAGHLQREGYDVVVAGSGEEGIELLDSQHVDCILLDVLMPGLSGEETCRRIKQSMRLRDIPLIMVTAMDDRSATIAGINAGADDYVAKGADFEILKARLRAQLRRSQFEQEHRRMREQLVRRQNELRFQQLLHSSIIGAVLVDDDQTVIDANDALLHLIGRERDEIPAGRLRWNGLVAPGSQAIAALATSELASSGTASPRELELIREDGTSIPVLYGAVRLEGATTAVGFVLDRTSERQSEQRLHAYTLALEQRNRELEAAREQAQQESQFKSRFLSNMSHELRTPLNAVIGFAELMAEGVAGELTPTQSEFLGNVVSGGRHLLSLVNDILDLSRVAAGRLSLQRDWHPVGEILEGANALAQPLLRERQQQLEIVVAPSMPLLWIDPLRIRQVVFNLVSNAIKFSPPGSRVQLAAAIEGAQVRISCTDHGIGIAAADLPRLFHEFERIESRASQGIKGTGLGLALSRHLVELHGGEIVVSSEPGVGSTFSFTIPLDAATTTAPTSAPPATVLVVADDAHAAELVSSLLRSEGLVPAVARDLEETVRLARQLRPAAIALATAKNVGLEERLAADAATSAIALVTFDPDDDSGARRKALLAAIRASEC